MKLTKETLKRIIKEELEAVMDEGVRGDTTEEDEFEMSLVGSVLSGNTRKLEKEKKLLKNLAYYLGNPQGVPPQTARTEIGRIKKQLREPAAKGYDLDDPRIVADLVRLYDDISQNTLKYYRKHNDRFDDFASGSQIHKLAKEKFGNESGGVDSDGKGRSFTQKLGSFFTGKGFKEGLDAAPLKEVSEKMIMFMPGANEFHIMLGNGKSITYLYQFAGNEAQGMKNYLGRIAGTNSKSAGKLAPQAAEFISQTLASKTDAKISPEELMQMSVQKV